MNNKIKIFEDIESIDDKTAILLYNNGFTTIDDLKNSSLNDLIKIKEINKKIAKKIRREINKKFIA